MSDQLWRNVPGILTFSRFWGPSDSLRSEQGSLELLFLLVPLLIRLELLFLASVVLHIFENSFPSAFLLLWAGKRRKQKSSHYWRILCIYQVSLDSVHMLGFLILITLWLYIRTAKARKSFCEFRVKDANGNTSLAHGIQRIHLLKVRRRDRINLCQNIPYILLLLQSLSHDSSLFYYRDLASWSSTSPKLYVS